MNALSYWSRRLLPSSGPLALVVITVGMGVLGLLLAFAYGRSTPGSFLTNFGFVMGVLYAPAAAIVLALAGLWEKRRLPRAGLWLAGAAILAVGGVLAAPGLIREAEMSPAAGVAALGFFYLPPIILLLAGGLYHALNAWPAERARQQQVMLDVIEARGEVDIREAAKAAGLSAEQGASLLQALAAERRFDGALDLPTRRVYGRQTLVAKRQRLLAIVRARGEMTLTELADELAIPRRLLQEWIYQAVGEGEFSGYLNWDEDRIFSVEAEKLRTGNSCPRCGGDLALAGKGVIRCRHCGSEIFL